MTETKRLSLIANITASYLRRNSVAIDQVGGVVASVAGALEQVSQQMPATGVDTATAANRRPAVPVKKSIQSEYLVCLEDGKRSRTLKRHLQSAHGMTPQQYREKWQLPKDYPMVAPAYSEQRSRMAKAIGFGRKPAPPPPATPKSRPRKVSAKSTAS